MTREECIWWVNHLFEIRKEEYFNKGMMEDAKEAVLISTFWGVRIAERDAVKEDGTDDFWYLFLNDATAHPRYVF